MAKKPSKAKKTTKVKKGQDEGLKFLQSLGIQIAKNQSALKKELEKRYGTELYMQFIKLQNNETDQDGIGESMKEFVKNHPDFYFDYEVANDGIYIRHMINYFCENDDLLGERILVKLFRPIIGMYLAVKYPEKEVELGIVDDFPEEYYQYMANRLAVPSISIRSYNADFSGELYDTVINDILDTVSSEYHPNIFEYPLDVQFDIMEEGCKKQIDQFGELLNKGGHFVDFQFENPHFFVAYAWHLNKKGLVVDYQRYRESEAVPFRGTKYRAQPIVGQYIESLSDEEFFKAVYDEEPKIPLEDQEAVSGNMALAAEQLSDCELVNGLAFVSDCYFASRRMIYKSRTDDSVGYYFGADDSFERLRFKCLNPFTESAMDLLDLPDPDEEEKIKIVRFESKEEFLELISGYDKYIQGYTMEDTSDEEVVFEHPIRLSGVVEPEVLTTEEESVETVEEVVEDVPEKVFEEVSEESPETNEEPKDEVAETQVEKQIEETLGKTQKEALAKIPAETSGDTTSEGASSESKPINNSKESSEEEERYREIYKEHLLEKQTRDHRDWKGYMGQYIGKIDCYENGGIIYYNFMPIYKIEEKSLSRLFSIDRQQLIPDSVHENINLSYDNRYPDQCAFMAQHLCPNMLAVMEFDPDELEHNIWKGTMNKTGYKVMAIESIKKKRFAPLSEIGFYQVIQEAMLPKKMDSANILELGDGDFCVDEDIMIDCGNDFLAGPYTVKFREADSKFYIRPRIRENKYVLQGYRASDCKRRRFDNDHNDVIWLRYMIQEGAIPVEKDVMSDEDLLSAFFNEVKGQRLDLSRPDSENIAKVVEQYINSSVRGKNLSLETVENRERRLLAILHSEEKLLETLLSMTDILAEIIIKYQDTDAVGNLLEALLKNNPDLLENLPNSRVMRNRLAAAKTELEQIETQKEAAREKAESDNRKEVLDAEVLQKEKMLANMQSRLLQYSDIRDLDKRLNELKKSVADYEKHKEKLQEESKLLEEHFEAMIDKYRTRMMDLSFDGFMSSKMLQAAAKWEHGEESDLYEQMVAEMNKGVASDKTPEELVEYVVRLVQIERPQYDRNLIINLLVCIFQGFLTVFSGEPGCGKTSICNILARILGMMDSTTVDQDRYIPVSVGRGWTSKNDFIGYYNPLTKSFEENNKEVYEGLKMLNLEYKLGYEKYPFLILLDEANLSPMEFYWADFMNICDDRKSNHVINLGNDNVFSIPKTLHFVATINNDHTTQVLSPRLIDRAWVISLPKNKFVEYGDEIPEEMIERITWKSISEAFVISRTETSAYTNEVQEIYEGLKSILVQEEIVISPRMEIAIRKYWNTASRLMVDTDYCEASVVALDYAIAQKILPKLSGMGDEFLKWLETVKTYCNENGLQISGNLIQNIIYKGNRRMRDYQFFN